MRLVTAAFAIAAGVIVREDMDEVLWQDAGDIKAIHRRIALADCCCRTRRPNCAPSRRQRASALPGR